MRDLVFLALVLGFFLLAGAYVTACERIAARAEADPAVGPDQPRTAA